MLRRGDGHALRKTFYFLAVGQQKKVRMKRTWKKQFEEESLKVGLRRVDALCPSKWIVGCDQVATGLR